VIASRLKNYNKVDIKLSTSLEVDTLNKHNFVLFLAIFLVVISCNFMQDVYATSLAYCQNTRSKISQHVYLEKNSNSCYLDVVSTYQELAFRDTCENI